MANYAGKIPPFWQKTWSASKICCTPEKWLLPGFIYISHSRITRPWCGMSPWDDLVLLTIFSVNKNNKQECINIAWYRKIFPRHMSNLLSLVFWSIWKWSRRSSEENPSKKSSKKKHNVDLETWQQRQAQQKEKKLSLCDKKPNKKKEKDVRLKEAMEDARAARDVSEL